MGVSATFAASQGEQKSASAQAPAPQTKGPLVLIDPGHGGTNAGAPSVREGLYEKHLTLAMAGVLKEKLEKRGFEVKLTRRKDTYLSLRERGQMANAMNADLFVSLHANATENHSHSGYETFILTPDAVDVDSRALRHESARVREGVSEDIAHLLDDVERSTSQRPAARIAGTIQAEIQKVRGKSGNRGVRQDSQHVLLGATMPAMLIEVGFIDHPVEGEEILDAELRNSILEAVATAIDAERELL